MKGLKRNATLEYANFAFYKKATQIYKNNIEQQKRISISFININIYLYIILIKTIYLYFRKQFYLSLSRHQSALNFYFKEMNNIIRMTKWIKIIMIMAITKLYFFITDVFT